MVNRGNKVLRIIGVSQYRAFKVINSCCYTQCSSRSICILLIGLKDLTLKRRKSLIQSIQSHGISLILMQHVCNASSDWTVGKGSDSINLRCCDDIIFTHFQLLSPACQRLGEMKHTTRFIIYHMEFRYFVPQVPITGKIVNGYPMFSVKNIVQNVKLKELWGKISVPLHFVKSKS